MKVALIDVNCKHSSTGKIVYDLYTDLNKNGHEAAVYYGRGPKINEKNIFKFGIDLETYFHALMTRITGFTGVFSPFSTCRVIRKLKKFKPDIVHIHELHAYFINLKPIMNYLKSAPVKVIWTFHCEFMFTGKCAYTYGCNKWETECNKCPQVQEYPKSLVFDFSNPMFRQKKELFKNFDNLRIVTPSEWLEKRVKRSFLKNQPTTVINNGVDLEIFKYRESKLKSELNLQNNLIILSVAPNIFDDRKGGKDVLTVAEAVKHLPIVFIMIGVEKKLDIDLNNVIQLPKTKNQFELSEFYSIADAFLILSNMENYPTTCLEALCCGTPTIGFNTGGTAETARHGFSDFVKFGDLNSIINLITNLKNNDIESRNDIINSYQTVHSKATMTNNYLNLYSKETLN